MNQRRQLQRLFLMTSFVWTITVMMSGRSAVHAQTGDEARPLIAYVGTYTSPLKNMRTTQVDLPPGNGRGIHLFKVNRLTGVMTPYDLYEMGTSPSALVFNKNRTRMYSANETERTGAGEAGSVSAFAVSPTDGKLKLLNSVSSGGKGPAHLSIHPSGKVRAGGQLLRRQRGRASHFA